MRWKKSLMVRYTSLRLFASCRVESRSMGFIQSQYAAAAGRESKVYLSSYLRVRS